MLRVLSQACFPQFPEIVHLLLLADMYAFLVSLSAYVPCMAMSSLVACMPPKKKPKAKAKDDKLDTYGLNRMLSSLRYQMQLDDTDPEKAQMAKYCRETYDSFISNTDRNRFIAAWHNNGKGKNKDDLQFAVKFRQEMSQTQEDEWGSQELWLIPAQILKMKGYSMSDFQTTDKALARAKKLWEENRDEFKTSEKAPQENKDDPEMTRYFWVQDEGHKRKWRQEQSKKIDGSADISSSKQMAAMGVSFGSSAISDGPSEAAPEVKLESPIMISIKEAAEKLRTHF